MLKVSRISKSPHSGKRVSETLAEQLTLNVRLRDEATFDSFHCVREVRPAVNALQARTENLLYLYGPTDSGRSHLLQAACHYEPGLALYLPLSDLRPCAPADVLEGAESASLVCLDDVDAVIGSADWEEALFHLMNRALHSHTRLVFSAGCAPRQLGVVLPDLLSRLSWSVVFALPETDDEQLRALLLLRASQRGIQLSEPAVEYIMRRCERRSSAVMALLERLDKMSLAQGRHLTRDFVAEVMNG